jgi:hypothetical protein
MGRMVGKGEFGGLKETLRMGEVETMVWIVERAYDAGRVSMRMAVVRA